LFGVLGEYRIARFGRFYKEVGGFTWRVSDCEELVGVNASQRHWSMTIHSCANSP